MQQRRTGAIRYASGTGVRYCNSAAWTTLASGAGVTGTGSATAVAFWNSSAGLTYDAGLYWDNSNKRLGVGTTTPTQAFEVSGSLRISKSNGNPTAVIKIPDATALGQFSVNDETGCQSYYGFIGSDAGQGTRNSTTEVGSRNTDITLRPGETETMRLTTSGKVGIGTNAPAKQLVVSSSASADGILVANSAAGSGAVIDLQSVDTGGTTWRLQSLGNVAGRVGNFDIVQPGFGTALTINKTTMNVGISGGGLITPTVTLQVSGTFIVSNSAQVTTPSIYVHSTGRVGIGNTTPGDALDIRGANANIDTAPSARPLSERK